MAKSAEVKLAIFGRAGVGKSALVVRFLTKRFIWEYDPTLESTYRHQATIDDEVVSMEILDTAGQVRTLLIPVAKCQCQKTIINTRGNLSSIYA
uniref:small monomeric GTPase n=1 Tax=Pseudonaja textilis TaxID=8673 RepID=A0A670Y2K7_PSETE